MPETASKHPLEDDYKAEMKRRLEAEARLEESNQEKKRLQNQLSALRRTQGVESTAKPPEEKKEELAILDIAPEALNKEAPLGPAPKIEHMVRPWEKFCPDCGSDNPEWKDETECVDCHTPLGAVKYVSKMKKCPNGNCSVTSKRDELHFKLRSHINPNTIDFTGVKTVA
jgi:hypothetical protein